MSEKQDIQNRIVKRGKRVVSVCLATGILLSSVPFYTRADVKEETSVKQYEVQTKEWGQGTILLEKTKYWEGETVTFRLKPENGYEVSKIRCVAIEEESEQTADESKTQEKSQSDRVQEETETEDGQVAQENQEIQEIQGEEVLLIKKERTEEIYEFMMPASNVSLEVWFFEEKEEDTMDTTAKKETNLIEESATMQKEEVPAVTEEDKTAGLESLSENSDEDNPAAVSKDSDKEEPAAVNEDSDEADLTVAEDNTSVMTKAAARAVKGDIGVKQILDYPLDATGTSYLNYESPISGNKMRVSLHRTSDDEVAYCLNRTKSSDKDDYNWDYDLVENKDTKYTDLQRNILLCGYPGNTAAQLKEMYDVSINARTAEQATQLAIWIGNYMISEDITLSEAWKSHAPYNTGDYEGVELCRAILKRASDMLDQKLTVKGILEKEDDDTVTYVFQLTTKAQYYPVTGTISNLPEDVSITCDEAITCTDAGENQKTFTLNQVEGTAKISMTFSKYAKAGTIQLKASGTSLIPPTYGGILYYDNRDSDYQSVVQVKEVEPYYEEKEAAIPWEPATRKIYETDCKIIKKDRETGKIIAFAGTRFQIRKKDTGEIVSQHDDSSSEGTIEEFSTNEEGYLIMPEKLQAGTYLLYELEAPTGYVLEEEPVEFTVPEDDSEIIEVVMENTPQRVELTIEKQGIAFCRAEEKSVDLEGMTDRKIVQPIFEELSLEGVTYELQAAEDISTLDGTCRIGKGTVFQATTNSEGKAVFENLYPGRYELKETKTLEGYLGEETQEVVLTCEDPMVTVKKETISQTNYQQVPELKFTKIMGENPYLKVENAVSQVFFGLYAGEDLKSQKADGTAGEVLIAKGTLMDIYRVGEDGQAVSVYETRLPYGNYYIEEIKTHSSYVLDSTQYAFRFALDEKSGKTRELVVTENPIENKMAVGTLLFTKQDVSTGNPISGCKVEIKNQDGTVLVQGTTDEKGEIYFENLPLGVYTYREYEAPEGYVLDETEYSFEIKEDGQVVKTVMENDRQAEETTEAEETTTEAEKEKETEKAGEAKTADETPIGLYGSLMAFSVGLGVGAILWKKKRRR